MDRGGWRETKKLAEDAHEGYLPGSPAFWRAAAALTIASFIIFANIYQTQPLLPLFSRDFGVSPAVSSLAVSVTIFALGGGLLFYGPLSDMVGRRPVMLWTMALSVVPALAAPLVHDFNLLLVIRVLQGLTLAGLPSVAMAYLSEECAPKALGLGIGLYIGGNSVGGMCGRIISGVVAEHFGWRASFLVMGVMGLVGVVAFYLLLPPSRNFKPKATGIRPALAGYAGHLRNPVLLKAFFIAFFLMFTFVGVFNYVTYLLSAEPYNLSPSFLGWLFVTYAAGTVSSAVAGRLVDHLGGRPVIACGVCIAIGALVLLHLPLLWQIVVGLLVFCCGFFAAHAAASAWVNGHTAESKASAAGLYLIFYYLGGSTGSTALGILWGLWGWDGVIGGALVVLLAALAAALSLKHRRD
ncbi:MAG: MFS transporter [Peptococcaceae bacterium]|nr:MFS transporter [Peptococcaceae bacterium]